LKVKNDLFDSCLEYNFTSLAEPINIFKDFLQKLKKAYDISDLTLSVKDEGEELF